MGMGMLSLTPSYLLVRPSVLTMRHTSGAGARELGWSVCALGVAMVTLLNMLSFGAAYACLMGSEELQAHCCI